MSTSLEEYLTQLRHELRKNGIMESRIVEETREHLADAIHAALQRGISVEAAESEALAKFGTPQEVAAQFAEEKGNIINRLYSMLMRVATPARKKQTDATQYHDVSAPSRYHFALRLTRPHRKKFTELSAQALKQFIADRRERGEEMRAFEPDPRERLAHFLREFGRRTFRSGGTLESLTLLANTAGAGNRGGRYLAAFGTGTKMIWTVVLSVDGSVSFDGFNTPA